MKRKLKQWIAVLCLLMLLAASLHLARAESAPAQEECAPYRIVLTAPRRLEPQQQRHHHGEREGRAESWLVPNGVPDERRRLDGLRAAV